MEKKRDTDIEKIKDLLQNEPPIFDWNKASVWERIDEEQDDRKGVFFLKWSIAASVAAILMMGFFWLNGSSEDVLPMAKTNSTTVEKMPQPTISVAKPIDLVQKQVGKRDISTKKGITVTKPIKRLEPGGQSSEIELAKTQHQIIGKEPEIVTQEQLVLVEQVSTIEEPILQKQNPLISSGRDNEIDELSPTLRGKKLTLLIPETEKRFVNDERRLLGFIKRVGEFNRTGIWHPRKEGQLGNLWAKFVESTKSEKRTTEL